jgi:hypothetical protein
MAKKSKSSGTAKTKARKKSAGARKSGGAAKTARGPLTSMDAMEPAQRNAAFRAVQAALAQHRVKGTLTALHFETDVTALLCQPPQVRRMVCQLVNGVVVCEPKCVAP